MKRIVLPFVSVLAALALPSCLQQATTIHLNKDGSGTLVEETTFGAQMTAMLEQMAGLGGAQAKDPVKELISKDKAAARAAKLGAGVTVEKAEAIETNGNKGGRVTYHFTDINTLNLALSGGLQEAMPKMPGAPEADQPKEKPTTFKYAGGLLTITTPEPKKPDPAAAGKATEGATPELGGEQMEGMMKQMLGDMKISFKVVIEPGIAETNATNVAGNTVTLMEMDMGKVMENPEALKALKGVDQTNPEKAMEALKGVKGVKVEPKPEITIKVK
ncbi:MAG: hypothetical protein NTW21_34530 [Verrucomicrobia bacterium]|nr:hypothetical protein [Verrucomicrobiota bacterium]